MEEPTITVRIKESVAKPDTPPALEVTATGQATDIEIQTKELLRIKQKINEILSDNEKPGVPAKFTAEQVCQILSVACEKPEDSNLPLSHWSLPALRLEVIKRGIVENISVTHLGRFLK